jgi:hypothetical protein
MSNKNRHMFTVNPPEPPIPAENDLVLLVDSISHNNFESAFSSIIDFGKWSLNCDYGYDIKLMVVDRVLVNLPLDTNEAVNVLLSILKTPIPGFDILYLIKAIINRKDITILIQRTINDKRYMIKLTAGCTYYDETTKLITGWTFHNFKDTANYVIYDFDNHETSSLVLKCMYNSMYKYWTGYEPYMKTEWLRTFIYEKIVDIVTNSPNTRIMRIIQDSSILERIGTKPIENVDALETYVFDMLNSINENAFIDQNTLVAPYENTFYIISHISSILKKIDKDLLERNYWIYLYATRSVDHNNSRYRYDKIIDIYRKYFGENGPKEYIDTGGNLTT